MIKPRTPLTDDQRQYIKDHCDMVPAHEIASELGVNYYKVVNAIIYSGKTPIKKRYKEKSEDRFEVADGIFNIYQRENWLV